MTKAKSDKIVINTASAQFGPYDYIDPPPNDITLLKLSYEKQSHQGAYMMIMQPGAETEIHTHARREEYFIIEGDLIESDGTVLGPGDFIIFQPGTTHNSRTETGCRILAIDYSWSDAPQ
jgi:mannose-6-phosphate isomerase-like protein (cupin superfamily)